MSWWKRSPCSSLISPQFFGTVTAEKAVWLTFVSQISGNSSVALQFPSRIPHSGGFQGSLWLHWLPVGQFSFAQCFIKYWILHEFSYLRAVKYQPWVSPCLSVGTSSGGKQTHCLPGLLPSLTSSLLLTWYVKMEVVFCSVQREDKTECYASQGLTLILTATLVWHNVSRQPSCPRNTESKDTLSIHLRALEPV